MPSAFLQQELREKFVYKYKLLLLAEADGAWNVQNFLNIPIGIWISVGIAVGFAFLTFNSKMPSIGIWRCLIQDALLI